MKKDRWKRWIGMGMILLCAAAAVTSRLLPAQAEVKTYTVVVDPGHGGEDGGAVGEDGTLEKDLNLQIALLLKEQLEQHGFTVVMTRQTDEDTDGLNGFHKKQDLAARVQRTAEVNADLFLSVHINASSSRQDKGFQVWYGTGNNDGQALAEAIKNKVEEAQICTRIRVVKPVPESLYVFRTVTVPNVLIECGFISNAEDRRLLQQPEHRLRLAEAICAGVMDYCAKNDAIT